MPFRAPPSQWSATIDVLLRETLAAAFIGKLAHVFDRQLQLIDGANWTPRARRLLAIGADAVGRGLPPVAILTLPRQRRVIVDVALRQARAAARRGHLLHVFKRVSWLLGADRTPRAFEFVA